MKDDFVDARGAAEILGLKPGTLAVWRSRSYNRGPRYKKIGGKILYRKSDLLEFIDSHTVETTDSSQKHLHQIRSAKS